MKLPNTFDHILIVRTDRIGDVVLTTPAIKTLREAYPLAKICVLVAPATYDLIKGNPYVDEILVDDRNGKNRGLFGTLRLIREIRKVKFDLAVVFHTKRRYNLACYLAGIPYRLGYKNNKFGSLLSIPIKDFRVLGEKHESEYCVDLLKCIGIENDGLDVFVPIQKEAEVWLSDWLKENDLKPNEFITIHAGASDATKCWPVANFVSLMQQLSERYPMKIVLIGSPQTVSVAEEIIRHTRGSSKFIDLTGKTSLAQMVSLLKATRLLISNDSGPVHVAAGVGTSVISLFLRNQPGINAKRWKPLGPKSFILINKPGEEVKLDAKSNAVAGQPDSIGVEDVLVLVEQIFQKDGQYEIF